MVEDGTRDDACETITRDDEQPDTAKIREQEVHVLQRHGFVGLPHGPVDLNISRRPRCDLWETHHQASAHGR